MASASPARCRVAAASLRARLSNLDFAALGISEYNQRYLGDHLASREAATLRLYARLLHQTLASAQKPLRHVVLVDFGGGHGLMSLLAKELGVGTVIYVDVYDVSCADVERLGQATGLAPDRIVCGDLEDLILAASAGGLQIDGIVSSDVIEHIYDVPGHLDRLAALPSGPFRAVYASTANSENPRYVRRISSVQLEVELKPRKAPWGHKDRDSLQAYRAIRADIIRRCSPTMPEPDVEKLAAATRGLIERDIEKAVREFERAGRISYRINHPTNTCDPITGNWTEHLMELGWLKATAERSGFTARLLPGRYDPNGSVPKRVAQVLLNATISALGRRGMMLAPYYVLILDR